MTIRKEDFIAVSKNMVIEFYNLFIDKTNEKILISDLNVIGFHETPECYRILIETPTEDGLIYEVVYDIENGEFHSYTYRKTNSMRRKHYKNSKYYREKIMI